MALDYFLIILSRENCMFNFVCDKVAANGNETFISKILFIFNKRYEFHFIYKVFRVSGLNIIIGLTLIKGKGDIYTSCIIFSVPQESEIFRPFVTLGKHYFPRRLLWILLPEGTQL